MQAVGFPTVGDGAVLADGAGARAQRPLGLPTDRQSSGAMEQEEEELEDEVDDEDYEGDEGDEAAHAGGNAGEDAGDAVAANMALPAAVAGVVGETGETGETGEQQDEEQDEDAPESARVKSRDLRIANLKQTVVMLQTRLAQTRDRETALRTHIAAEGCTLPPELASGLDDGIPGPMYVESLHPTLVHFNPNTPYDESSGETPYVLRCLIRERAGDGNLTGHSMLGAYKFTSTTFPHTIETYSKTNDVNHPHIDKRTHLTLQFGLCDRQAPDRRVSEQDLLEGMQSAAVPFRLSLIHDETGQEVTLDSLNNGHMLSATTDPPLATLNSPPTYMSAGLVTFHLNKVFALSASTKHVQHGRFRFKCQCLHPKLKHFKHLTALTPPVYSVARSRSKTLAARGSGYRVDSRGRGGRGGRGGR